MLYAMVLGVLSAAFALAIERVARCCGLATRWGWIAGIGATCVIPIATALRPAPAPRDEPVRVVAPLLAPDRAGVARRSTTGAATPAPVPTGPRPQSDTPTRSQGAAARTPAGPPPSSRPRPLPTPSRAPSGLTALAATLSNAETRAARLDPALIGLWILASCAVAFLIGHSLATLRRQMRDWQPATFDDVGDMRDVPVLVSSATGPAVFGVLRMRVVIPEWTLQLDRASRDLMLAHEREHARARDPRLLALGAVAGLVAPWNPMIWWQLGRLRSAIEIDCDARVLRGAVVPRDYARLLVAVGGHANAPVSWAAAFAQRQSLLERRITAMSDRRPRRPLVAAAPFALVAVLAMTAAVEAPRPAPIALSHARERTPRPVPLAPLQASVMPLPWRALHADNPPRQGTRRAPAGPIKPRPTPRRPDVDASGTWMDADAAYGPWVIELAQTGGTVSGTVRQAGGERGPAEVTQGTVRGDSVWFRVTSPDGFRAVSFGGTVAGDSLQLDRRVDFLTGGPGGGSTGIFGAQAVSHFVAGRSTPAAAAAALDGARATVRATYQFTVKPVGAGASLSGGAVGGGTAARAFPAAARARFDRALSPAIPAIRPLGPIVAQTKDPIRSAGQIRPLSDGRVLMNDPAAHRIVLFDSSLAAFDVVADSETPRAYGAQGMPLFAYYGDSSLLADVGSLALVVVDPNGTLGRVTAAPKGMGGGLFYMRDASYGVAFDGVGHLVSRWNAADPFPALPLAKEADTAMDRDSAVLTRVDLATRRVDTVARLRGAGASVFETASTPNCIKVTNLENPLPLLDAWTVMNDGTIAIVRAYDYHIDWISPDGARSSSPRIPHAWVRLTDSMRVALLDSARIADSLTDERIRALRGMPTRAQAGDLSGTSSCHLMGMNGAPMRLIEMVGYPPHYPDPSSLPDYLPPFLTTDSTHSPPVRADAEGNLWIRSVEAKRFEGGAVFDVVNRAGALVDRVQIPGGTDLVGFGPGVVYLIAREGAGYRLARARIR